MTLAMPDARMRAIAEAEDVLYALLSARAAEALKDSTYLRVLTNALYLRSFLLDWEIAADD